ncbi:hydroxymethylbilane synthase [Elizabethkingia sp. JS20170427COW]|uniref:hydroxymethylbilane synthase n=1 Tax=Elizabethkingia sp. JS20170427COW TaxID=2583851 RepID=UPI0011107CB3|nr:hydroxymethylbilane synthase [Elizabethkingia sp. JS20170427COW]QCX53046.1 hydroxymethylbilane synthase [Elizabethkingia sp. JS20170427COW]
MKTIKIGTRNSPLAMWQAEKVASQLQAFGHSTEIIPVVSHGDKNLKEPLYALGITGVFTKDLDIALLNKEVDVAVHSLKDVPTALPMGVILSAYLQRDYPEDVLIRNKAAKGKDISELSVATSSLRRKSFWLDQHPGTHFTDIRGNVQTRLNKLEEGLADATLLSLAGIKRMNMDIEYEEVPFLLQAPSQGVVCCASLEENEELTHILKEINHPETQKCVEIERAFLRHLEGGCTAPIGAKATMEGNKVSFEGRIVSLDGAQKVEVAETVAWRENLGIYFAEIILNNNGKAIMEDIKTRL